MNTSKKVLNKDKTYKIKSKKLIRIYSYFLIRWDKLILLKSIKPTTKNIKQNHQIRHFIRNINSKSFYTKLPFQSLKNPILSCQIQKIF